MARWLIAFLALIGVVGAPQLASASVAVLDEDGTYLGEAVRIKGFKSFSNDTAETGMVDVEQRIHLPIGETMIRASSTAAQQITDTTDPHLRKKSTASGTFIRWLDNVTSPVQLKFRIPANYQSGGAFRLLVGREGATGTTPAIDFQVFIDKNVTAFDTAATDQTAVALSTSTNGGSPEQLTLTVATDFASLAAGDVVTLELWRDNVNASTEWLEVYYAEFYYTARN